MSMEPLGLPSESDWALFIKQQLPQTSENSRNLRVELVKQESLFNLWNQLALTPVGKLFGLKRRAKVQIKDQEKSHGVRIFHLSNKELGLLKKYHTFFEAVRNMKSQALFTQHQSDLSKKVKEYSQHLPPETRKKIQEYYNKWQDEITQLVSRKAYEYTNKELELKDLSEFNRELFVLIGKHNREFADVINPIVEPTPAPIVAVPCPPPPPPPPLPTQEDWKSFRSRIPTAVSVEHETKAEPQTQSRSQDVEDAISKSREKKREPLFREEDLQAGKKGLRHVEKSPVSNDSSRLPPEWQKIVQRRLAIGPDDELRSKPVSQEEEDEWERSEIQEPPRVEERSQGEVKNEEETPPPTREEIKKPLEDIRKHRPKPPRTRKNRQFDDMVQRVPGPLPNIFNAPCAFNSRRSFLNDRSVMFSRSPM